MESVILNTNDSILITEVEPYDLPGPRIIFVNKAFTEMTGYSAEEVIGKTPRILQNEYTDRKELDKLRIALDKWEPCEITISNSRKNGEKFWNNVSVVPIANEKGSYTHWIAVERDVTKEIEAAIEKERMIEELLKNNLELKQFSYITTHNLRAPLTNLILISKLISREKIENPSTLQLVEGFKTSTYQLNETLNDLINVLIIKENIDLTLDQLYFEEIIDKVKKSISKIVSNSKTIIETDFSDAPTVHFTQVYLESIFLNLITNSIKYCHPERNPIVKIKTIKDAFGVIKLTFSDNGIGMDMSRVKHKIFGFHQRFHENADSKGIGLFLVKSQINALGGEIEVDSEMNIGTTFTITFKE
jgi:PAS domain S-box-containing protein